ncbi:helix-turn-helix transcriptional regulator [Herbidospora mongoliensis]|uniref:helix-turn-helix transcriptional regulator n=1 Tax=Herbidospora mongoliensis TaxID=688067 RepID=UPI0012FB2131|nr:LuxR family transcriptional regulator [Herbidospora mongoliensis]
MWPFMGRTAERDQIRAAARDGGGVLVTGPAGSGRTRLLTEALAPFSFLLVRARAADVPFGAFAHLLPGPACTPVNPVYWAARALGPIPPVLAVDDVHLLDPSSAALIAHLAEHHGTTPILTAGAGAPLPEPIAALWRDGALTRIDLSPLTVRETGGLLAAALGGPAEIATVRRLHHTTGGNPRLITELLPGTAMIRDGGVWRWDGELTLPPRLRQLLEAELAGLTPAETTVIELVALTEPVDLDVLLGLADQAAVALLERRGLITVLRDTSPPRVRLACPLHAHVVRDRATALGVRDGLALLGGASPRVEGLSAREAEVARLASWNLTNREIADWLVLSPRTVANHLCRVYTKLGVNNRADLAPLLAA